MKIQTRLTPRCAATLLFLGLTASACSDSTEADDGGSGAPSAAADSAQTPEDGDVGAGLGEGSSDGQGAGAGRASELPPPGDDPGLADWKGELLALAYSAASAFPIDPLVKDRSRLQDSVVELCYELDQPQTGLDFTLGIENWRRGLGFAGYARWCAEHDRIDLVDEYLQFAVEEAKLERELNPQIWRRERILSRVAQTRLALGQFEAAASIELALTEGSESGHTLLQYAEQLDLEALNDELGRVRAVIEAGSFEPIKRSVDSSLVLHRRFYADEEARAALEEVVTSAREKLPLQMWIETLLVFSANASEAGAREDARGWIERATSEFEAVKWTAEARVPLMASFARHWFLAGDVERAGAEAGAALAIYDLERETIINMFRGEALRPLAEAFVVLGNADLAEEVYRRALDEGVVNPNSRPRAADLVETCMSLVRTGFEPSTETRSRMSEILAGLGDPW